MISPVFCVFLCLLSTAIAQYSDELGRRYFYYASASYCHPDAISLWTCSFCSVPNVTATVLYDRKTDTQAYIGFENSSNSIIVSFRGTDLLSLPNWIEDLSVGLKREYNKCKGCEIDDGFAKAHDAIQDQVFNSVDSMFQSYPAANLLITGHSLGGALAVLTAVDMALKYNNVSISLYTYGCPRVGNEQFADYFDGMKITSYRVVHWADPIARLPPQPLHYQHVQTQIWYNADSTNYEVCSGNEDPTCSDKMIFDPLGLIDHLTYMHIDFIPKWLECKA